jgi:hypothetical protein
VAVEDASAPEERPVAEPVLEPVEANQSEAAAPAPPPAQQDVELSPEELATINALAARKFQSLLRAFGVAVARNALGHPIDYFLVTISADRTPRWDSGE